MATEPEQSSDPEGPDNATWARLESQLKWYSRNSRSSQRWYKSLKVLQITLAAAIPAAAALGASTGVAAVMGGLIALCEGVQQLFRFHTDWTSYRSTAEALKREKYLFLAGVGDYAAGGDVALKALAVRVETLVSDETAKWAATQQEQLKAPEKQPPEQ